MTVNNRMSDGEVWSFVYDNADRLTKIRENNQDIMVMAYAANGNISSKTGIGSYTYGSSSKPHAVTEVDNTDGLITLEVMDPTYNAWGKVNGVWAYDENDCYSYSIGYGPDLQRVESSLGKTYNNLYQKFFWDDYEEKVVGSDTLHYYYVSGTDGLAGLHIVKTSPNAQSTSHTTKVITDHLGSIVSLIDNSDYVYDARFDVWGNREVLMSYWFDPTFERGFTGHEHIDELGLINMNGRMYDPLIGRFLSPDNYIQSITDPQNFNRYSYCLNNPLKYTDPDGEFVLALVGAILFTTGMTNVFIQASNDNINSFGDAMNAFLGGVAAGVSEGTSLAFGFAELSTGSPIGVLLGHSIIFGKSVNFTTTSVNSVLHPVNAAQIFLGRYYTDENGNAWDQTKQGLSRFMWEGPQTWAGYNWSQIRSITDRVDEVDYLGGATFCINVDGTWGSVSLGNYINADISGSYSGQITDYPVLMHEYGHTFDSREAGPAYLFTIGIPSLRSALNSEKVNERRTHSWNWTELRANEAAKKYFGKYYAIDWSEYENFVESKYYYPTVRPLPQMLQENYLEWYYLNCK